MKRLPVLCLLALTLHAQQQDVIAGIPAATDAWASASSPQQKDEVRRVWGPFDNRFLDALWADGELLKKKGDYAGALRRYSFCADVAEADNNNLEASICLQLTGGVERLQGKYPEAEAHYLRALSRAQAPGAKARIPLVLNNLASVYGAESRYAECADLLERAIAFNEHEGILNDASPYQNLAIVYSLQGDMARSLRNFLVALEIYRKLGDTGKIALTHHNIGALQIKQGNFEAAAGELETARILGEQAGDKTQLAQTLGDLGRVREAQHRPREALALMTRSLDLCRELGFRAGYVDALTDLGSFHLSRGDLAPAALRFEEARKIAADELHDGYSLGAALRGLGYVAQRQSDYPAAARYAAQALENARRIGDPDGEWQAQALEGISRVSTAEVPRARSAFTSAIALIERQRGSVAGGEVEKQRFFEHAVFPYRQLARLEMREGNALAALQVADRARSRVLLDILAAGPERIQRRMSDAERSDETASLVRISLINSRLSRAKPGEQTSLIASRDAAWHSYESFLSGLYLQHPELRTWRGESPSISEDGLAHLLPASNIALVEFLSAEDETLMFVATRDSRTAKVTVNTHRIAIGRPELAKQAQAFRALLEARDPGFAAPARVLYNLLIKPAAAELKGRTRIYLVPDGPLSSLPFQALLTGAGRYLIQDATLSYAPSLAFLRDQGSTPRANAAFSEDLFALGDPVRADSPPIPVLRDQVLRIAALYGPESRRVVVRVGSAANEAAFKAGAQDARVVHIAAHGVLDQTNALRSRVMLAESAAAGNPEDGWLEAWELMRMNLHADLVVLSACESGRGSASDGEGLVGLTWALFVSGVRTAIVSQWRVESAGTSELMVGLHRRLRSGAPPAEALRGAVLALMQDPRYKHPMYWAAFVSAGLK